jgi:hypothetical protein
MDRSTPKNCPLPPGGRGLNNCIFTLPDLLSSGREEIKNYIFDHFLKGRIYYVEKGFLLVANRIFRYIHIKKNLFDSEGTIQSRRIRWIEPLQQP